MDDSLVSAGFEQGIRAVTAGNNAIVKTHVSVTLASRPRLTTLRALALRVPPKMPIERVNGPPRPLPKCDDVKKQTERAVRAARREPAAQAQKQLNGAYRSWAQRAEQELEALTGSWLPKAGCLGQPPRLVWRTIIPEKLRRGDRSCSADGARRAMALLRDARLGQAAAKSGRTEHATRIVNEIADELNAHADLYTDPLKKGC